MKKAILDVQFNWIFVGVAGTLILLFFGSVVMKQRTASEDSISGTILVNLEPILTGAKVSTGTVNILDIPNREIEFSCSEYRVGRASRGLKDKIVFAPDLIKGTRIHTWALSFDAPFKVTNFLYLTSPQVRYIVVGSGSLYDELRLKVPAELGFEFYGSIASLPDNNNYRVKVVYMGVSKNDDHAADFGSKSKVTAIEILGSGSSGEIKFYDGIGGSFVSKGTSNFVYLESIIAAIFSQDKVMYECGMEKAFKKLNTVAGVYGKRSEKLAELYTSDGNSDCANQHTAASGNLDVLNNLDFVQDEVNSIPGLETGLAAINNRAQIFSCALIY